MEAQQVNEVNVGDTVVYRGSQKDRNGKTARVTLINRIGSIIGLKIEFPDGHVIRSRTEECAVVPED